MFNYFKNNFRLTTCLFNLLKPAYWCITFHLTFPDALANFIDCRCQDVVLDSFGCVRCATQSQALWKGVKRSFQYNLHWPHGTYSDKVEEGGQRGAVWAQCLPSTLNALNGTQQGCRWRQEEQEWELENRTRLDGNRLGNSNCILMQLQWQQPNLSAVAPRVAFAHAACPLASGEWHSIWHPRRPTWHWQ